MLVKIESLVGYVFSSFSIQNDKEKLVFQANDGSKFIFYHDFACCEQVYLEDICGDMDDIIGSEIIQAEEVSGKQLDEFGSDIYDDWTFYKLSTIKGSVTLRWLGESTNYSTEVVIEHTL